MNHHYAEVAVVGGGASGMIAALTAAEVPCRHVVLLERQQRIWLRWQRRCRCRGWQKWQKR